MRKHLLTLFSALIGITASAAPEGPLYMVGLNGTSAPDTSVALNLEERSEDDIDEGFYRWANDEFTLAGPGQFTVTNTDGTFSIGYDANNIMGASNVLSTTSPMMYLAAGNTPINCEFSAGRYKVSLALIEADAEDPTSTDTWMISFTSLDVAEDNENYYLLGFNGGDEPDTANKFVKTVTTEEGETVTTYSIPKFYIGSCPEGFRVFDSATSVYYGGTSEITDENPFAMLDADGNPVKSTLSPGYYTVNFASNAGFSMISFLRCENQTPASESEFYLFGFNGVTTPSDDVKFIRSVETYYDEEEETEVTSIIYKLEKFDIKNCADGFTVATADGSFSYGLDPQYAPLMGTSVTSGFGILGIYGKPMGWEMENTVYDITFTLSSDATAMISFMTPEDDSAIEGIEVDSDNVQSEYFNLQGIRIQRPEHGFYIERRGTKASKIYRP